MVPLLCAGVGLVMTVLFLCNIGMRYLSIGSLTGLIVFLLLFLYGVFPDRFAHGWKSMPKIMQRILAAAISVVLSLALATTAFMIAGIPPAPTGEETAVIILGSGVNEDGSPTKIMRARADQALDYLRAHPELPIITSGGLYSDDRISEAESLKRYLMDQSIDEDRILIENRSTSTEENLRNSARLLQEAGIDGPVLVVTSEFHSYRAGLYARRNHLQSTALSARTDWVVLPVCWIREMYGILYAWLIPASM